MAIAAGIGGVGFTACATIGFSVGMISKPVPWQSAQATYLGFGAGAIAGAILFASALLHYKAQIDKYFKQKHDSSYCSRSTVQAATD